MLASCVLVFTMNGATATYEATGAIVDDSHETWVVDFTSFIHNHPELKNINLVQFVPNNFCLYKGESYGKDAQISDSKR